MKPAFFLVVLALATACGSHPQPQSSTTAATSGTRQFDPYEKMRGVDDVLIMRASPEEIAAGQLEDGTSCREQIAHAVCLLDAVPDEEGGTVECLPGTDSYPATFEALYDNLPAPIQKMFCSVKSIYVLNHFEATAF